MKRLLVLFLFLNSFFQLSFGQEQSIAPEGSFLAEVLKQLNDIKVTDIDSHLYVEEPLLNSTKMVVIIPTWKKTNSENDSLEIHILIVDDETEKIESRFCELYVDFDALTLMQIEVDTVDYQLSNKIPTFGIKFHHRGNSRVCPYEATKLSLFAYPGKSLIKLLNHYPIREYMVEFYDLEPDLSWRIESESTITVDKKKTKGFRDLIIKDVIIYAGEAGEKLKRQSQRLQYQGSQYTFENLNLYQLCFDSDTEWDEHNQEVKDK